ncbi:hypothetical protein PTTG_04373 [Puccinia triticina 1-1 BBBD Race 1]|uniref:MBOAT_2 domain-containing protein n=2 Tax=Puccinia triticina TaxID=208348 RepID=A0A180GRN4_PUCT1|nr:uncharacterized protein PtA15_11A315 [Puccinia triticina]OAV95211.1 hypothetical protein PTTG_04373 [Puccinia triticina 1-1 BBBD Race 1]WAQ89625.1 hypothetical protein PtA15_11A315 [Puccinia triticina]WAR59643.1 hypothetical protein PtB15_11B283 [Puccinia triticina]
MMQWLRTSSHLFVLFIQAILLQLVWTQPVHLDSRRMRWTRISLLPLTLGLLFVNRCLRRQDSEFVRPFQANPGCMLTPDTLKAILLAFNQPSPARAAKLHASPGPHADSLPTILFRAVFLVIKASSNPSKQVKLVTGGSRHTIRADLAFLLSTVRRMLVLNTVGVLGLYCWKGVHDDALVGRFPILSRYQTQTSAVVWGVFIWTGIDLVGCLVRIAAFVSKAVHRLLSHHSRAYRNLFSDADLSRVDLEETCPVWFTKSPLEAASLSAFWRNHWHTMLQDLFVEAGAIPLTSLVRWTFASRKPHPKLLRLSGIIGAFGVSAILHEAGIWCNAGSFDRRLRTLTFFLSQAVAICLENGFKSLSGKLVDGPLGRIWTFSWLIFFGAPMIEAWLEGLAFDKHKMFDHANQLGLWRMLSTPFILPKLIFSFE